ncbi:hypothetical protein M9Y10_024621 [Tritrichomonas musculus]|uniref:Uncharacterized protein n=1 Tax=Tritrichomonas musculus TaxID=1915356 RepID=A0ABR2HAZ3_9EUKA
MTDQRGSQSQSQPPIDKPFLLAQDRGLVDLSIELDSLEKKNRFLEMIVQMYEGNPLKINSYVVLLDMKDLVDESYLYTLPVKYTGAPMMKSLIEFIDSSIGQ